MARRRKESHGSGGIGVYTCPVCGEIRGWITVLHMKTHGVETRDEFIKMYGEPKFKYVYLKKPS